MKPPENANEWLTALRAQGYLCDLPLAQEVHDWFQLADSPLLLQGLPGGGKSQLARCIAKALSADYLERLMFPGITFHDLVYRFDLDLLRTLASGDTLEEKLRQLADLKSNEALLVPGDCLKILASEAEYSAILFDEMDKVPLSDPHGATTTLLTFLEEFSIFVPELRRRFTPRGRPPLVFMTSNAGNKGASQVEHLNDALLRRATVLTIDPPLPDRQVAILRSAIPEIPLRLAQECVIVTDYVNGVINPEIWYDAIKRRHVTPKVQKMVSIGETIKWARRLHVIYQVTHLTEALLLQTLSSFIKHERDRLAVTDLGNTLIGHLAAMDKEGLFPAESI